MSDVETLKLLLIGNSSAGKSSLLLRFINDVWEPEDSQATIGVDFKTKLLSLNGRKVKLTIWDTAGQERFQTLTSSYYRGCQGVLVVFDVNNRASFDQLVKWFKELDAHFNDRRQEVVAFIVGNKIDRPGRLITREEAEQMVRRVHADGYHEVSAKDGTDVKSVFVKLTEQVLATIASTPSAQRANTDGIDISGGTSDNDAGCAC